MNKIDRASSNPQYKNENEKQQLNFQKLSPIKWKNFDKFQHKKLYGTSYGRYSSFDNQNV